MARVELWWKWVVLVAVYVESVIVASTTYCSGVMYVALLDRFKGDKATTSLIVSLPPALMFVLAPISSLVVNKFSCRVAVVTGGVILTISGVLSALATDLNVLLFTNGVLGGKPAIVSANNATSSASMITKLEPVKVNRTFLAFPVTAVVLGFYFDKQRIIAISMSVAVVGFGMFAASPLALQLLDTFGLSGTFMMFGAMNAHLCIVGIICKPSPAETTVQKQRLSSKSVFSRSNDRSLCIYSCKNVFAIFQTWCDLSVLKMAPFVFFQMTNITWSLMIQICFNHLPNYVTIHGADAGEITLLMACFSISNTCGRFLVTFSMAQRQLKDKSLIIQMCMLGLMGIVSILFPFFSHFEVSPYVFAVIVGAFTGGPNAFNAPITIRLVGVKRMSNANGFSLFCVGLGGLIGPPVAGFLYGKTGSYKYSFIFGGCISLVGCVLSLTVQILQTRNRKQSQHLTDPSNSREEDTCNEEGTQMIQHKLGEKS